VSPEGRVSEFAKSELLSCPNGITVGPDSNLYVVNFNDGRMLKITRDGKVSEHAMLPGGGNGHVTSLRGALYATSFRGNRIYKVGLDGTVTLFAGTGASGEKNGAALEATFTLPNGIAAGPGGDRLYVNDYTNRVPPTTEAPPAPRSSLRQITLASFSSHLAVALKEGGVHAMETAYRAWKKDPATGALFSEVEVNFLAYQLMGSGQQEAALELFELNAESYPKSANVWDSLAEAHLKSGHKSKAIEYYEKSLTLNPANDNAKRMLQELRKS
jgi:Tetratricopeptide repeat